MTGRKSPRWAIMEGEDIISAEGDPYLDRLRLLSTPWFGIYLHHIHRADSEDCGHDHPWSFTSFIVSGGYTEEIWPDKADPVRSYEVARRRLSLHFMGRKSAHRITSIDGLLWTLVICGPRRGAWGFWPNGRYTTWQEMANG